ncbi:transmembrane 9 superfamily protein member [Striga asiatica]|uniref:Transmembrane 9 superfamily member n=1 Tax=Striga asiatica TaxID=4170 RepID=A0A5A7PY68_STRAF|nr:transmembrane 9 superfamily protein member [Striga asiatica]
MRKPGHLYGDLFQCDRKEVIYPEAMNSVFKLSTVCIFVFSFLASSSVGKLMGIELFKSLAVCVCAHAYAIVDACRNNGSFGLSWLKVNINRGGLMDNWVSYMIFDGARLHEKYPDMSLSNVQFQDGETVTLWVNKVGPYNNPQETYNYYSLPFCRSPGNPAHKWGGLGEVLGGNELIDSQIDIKFKRDVERTTICEIELEAEKAKQFKDAIDNSYWFEFFMGMFVMVSYYHDTVANLLFYCSLTCVLSLCISWLFRSDDLPLWGFIGEVVPDRTRDTKHVLWTHKNIVINYNGNQIIHVNLTQENPKPLEEGRVLEMTYSVKWVPTNITFARRFDVYLDYPFFEHQEMKMERATLVYYVYGFMLLVFVILIIVTICVTIVGTYFLLNAENYHWQWTSFFSAASTALYVYLYSIYYYHAKTKMSGAVGYLGSNLFVRRIYRNIKCD